MKVDSVPSYSFNTRKNRLNKNTNLNSAISRDLISFRGLPTSPAGRIMFGQAETIIGNFFQRLIANSSVINVIRKFINDKNNSV